MASDVDIIRALKDGLPVEPRPYRRAAESLGMTEGEFVLRLGEMMKAGVLKRISAAVNHYALGWKANALVAWVVPEEKIAEAGRVVAEFKEVSHCYERRTAASWPYNLYAMVHARSESECRAAVENISARASLSRPLVLSTVREFKKSPAQI